MEQLICCSIKVQPARSGPKHLPYPGVCPPLAAKRREPPFDGCVPSNECSASPQRTPGSEAGVCPPLAAKRRELQWNSSSAVSLKFSQPAAHPGEQSQCFPASSGQPAAIRDTSQRPEKKSPHRSAPRGAKRTRYPGTGNPSLGFPAEKQSTGLFLLPS